MTNSVIPFSFEKLQVRVVRRDGGEPWFVAADVCEALGLDETHKMVMRLDDDEKGRNSIPTPGGDQEMTIINESGLYSLILTSRKPEAKRFKKWVTSEVLPAIRKTGVYVAPGAHQAGLTVSEAIDLLQKMVPAIITTTLSAVMEHVAADMRKFEHRFEERLAAGQIGTAAGVTTGVLLDDFEIKGVPGLSVRMSNILCKRGCQLPGGERAHSGKRTAKLFQPDKARQMMHDWLADDCRKYIKERKGQSNLFPIKRVV